VWYRGAAGDFFFSMYVIDSFAIFGIVCDALSVYTLPKEALAIDYSLSIGSCIEIARST
jgi:hypothetical protein